MKARFCDIYRINSKTMDPSISKQLDYQVDQVKIDTSEHYDKVFLFSDLFDISGPVPDLVCSILADSSSPTPINNILSVTTIYNNKQIVLEIQHNPQTLAS